MLGRPASNIVISKHVKQQWCLKLLPFINESTEVANRNARHINTSLEAESNKWNPEPKNHRSNSHRLKHHHQNI